jgi:hypothetical protein
MFAKQPLVCEQNFNGRAPRRTNRQRLQSRCVNRRDTLAHAEQSDDYTKIPGQCAFPAPRINAATERGADQFLKTFHPLDAGIIRRRSERIHMCGERYRETLAGESLRIPD